MAKGSYLEERGGAVGVLYCSDDYASLQSQDGRWDFYYGWEALDDQAQPSFVANLPNDGRVRFSSAELRAANRELTQFSHAEEWLLTGIGLLLDQDVLVLRETPTIDQ